MLARLLAFAALILWSLARPMPALAGWFYSITPPHGGEQFDVGPYNSEFGCKDWLGSALFDHPFACHLHPSPQNCRIVGNGFAYSIATPFPPPAQIPSGTCFEAHRRKLPDVVYFLPEGWYFFAYTENGGSIHQCRDYSHFKSAGIEVGSRCFFVGNTHE